MKCTDISSRLVDFLYEELPAAERSEFNAHLESCPVCAAEVKASSRALQRTRTALAGPLNEEPPARVHANILAAARAAAQPAHKPRVTEKEGFFTRLWKAPWLIPAMGAAGVATAVFLIKVIKNPEVLPVREPATPAMMAKPQPTEEESPPPTAAPAEPQDEAARGGIGKAEERKAPAAKRDQARSRSARPSPAPQGMIRMKKASSEDWLSGIELEGKGVGPTAPAQRQAPSESAAPAPKPAATARPLNNWAEPPPPRALAGKDRKSEDVDMLLKEDASGAGANQPRGEPLRATPQRAAEAPSPAPAASGFALPPAPSAAPAKAAPPASESRAKAKRAAATEDLADEVAESAPLHSVSAEKESDRADKKGGAKPESLQERVRKADKLYDEKKWAQAAIAYSALLAEAPSHPNAPTWRKRFQVAERAAKSQRPNDPAMDWKIEGIKF
jgi:hypothetical protein